MSSLRPSRSIAARTAGDELIPLQRGTRTGLFGCRRWQANLVAFGGGADANSWVEFNDSVENDQVAILGNARLTAIAAAARSVSTSPVASRDGHAAAADRDMFGGSSNGDVRRAA